MKHLGKRIGGILLALVMVLALLPGTLQTASAETEGDYEYSVTDGAAEITGYIGIGGDVVIPDTLGGYPVTSIGWRAFYGCANLTSITIPDRVTYIGDTAFYNCTSLTSVTIPDSVTSIGSNAFYNTALYNDESNWTDGVLYIENCLIAVKDDVVSGDYTVREGTSVIADGVLCDNLTSITIPSSVKGFFRNGMWFFYDDAILNSVSLASINVATGNSNYTSEDGVLFNKDKTELIRFPRGKAGTYTIPSSVTSLQYGTFSRCASLTSVTIPGSVTSIGPQAFGYCKSLTDVTMEDGVTEIGELMFYGCKSLTNIIIPDSVTHIGASAFRACTGLTSITIPDSVTGIGNHAFDYCTSLTSVTVGNGVKSIDGGTFAECENLTSVTFTGNAPDFYNQSVFGSPFYGVTATVYYPANDDTWTEEVRQDYGGELTWVAYEPETKPTEEPAQQPAAEKTVTYKVLDAQNTAWKAEKGGVLVVRSSADFSKFVEVRLDGKVLDKKNYEVKEGSTIVTIKAECLATLGGGEHTLEIVSTDGVATASFTVTAAANTAANTTANSAKTTTNTANSANTNGASLPKTGDTGLIALWLTLAIVSLAGAAIMILTDRKKRRA